jgi:hypothetical protein
VKIETEPRERYAAHLEDLVQIVLAKWKTKLTRLEYVMAEIAVERIIERSRRAIVSANYLDRAIENFFLDDEERNNVMDAANRRICLRDKWMGDLNEATFSNEPDPLLTSLFTPADIEHRQNVKLAIAESQRTGHSADWLLLAIKATDTAEVIGDDDGFVHIPQVMGQGKRERGRERESFSERRQRRSAGNGHRRPGGALPPEPGKQYKKPVRIDASEPKSPTACDEEQAMLQKLMDDFFGRGQR